jgi:DHA2 family multidrug resistance protein-like MFS transporter
LGQTVGAALVALLLARYSVDGTRYALLVGVYFAVMGAILSTLRLSPLGARGAEAVRVRDGQRATGE